jgi:hypothetical protein
MTTDFTQKYAKKYCCKCCDFNASKKNDYDRHLSTQKHKNNISTTDDNEKHAKKHTCNYCEKEYNDRAGLWRHKQKCQEIICDIQQDDSSDKDLIMMLIKQNSELLEVIKNGTHNTTNSNNTITNKTFNLQFFLNETCKDAMNIMDFVDSIKLQLSDLENVGKLGYVEGISNIITSNLKALDITQRPIHCADKKREVLYIKDENKWEKEDEEKKKIKKVINRVVSKNQRLLPQFKEAHPDCMTAASRYSDQYNKLIIEAMGGRGDNDTEKEAKIIKNITTVTTIDKDADI